MSYVCHICEKEFNSPEALEQHKKVSHLNHVSKQTGKNKAIVIMGIIVAAIFILIWIVTAFSSSSNYDDFAKCIASSGTKLYGAFWCSHCADQKNMFGSSSKYLPYVECSTPDKQSQLEVCINAGIQAYPTWIFQDGSRGGVLSLEQLSQKTNCPLPSN